MSLANFSPLRLLTWQKKR